jgi:hypothetical protein
MVPFVMSQTGQAVYHPNRETQAAKTTRGVVILLLLASAGLIAVITVAAWDELAGGHFLQIVFVGLDVLFAFYVARWRRGVLPIAAALAIIVGIFAVVSGVGWFMRDQPGIDEPDLGGTTIGTLIFLLVPLQLLLIAFALRGFAQNWNVEAEQPEQVK